MPAIAYFITWTTYGSWLRGNRRGSVSDDPRWGAPRAKPDPAREARDAARLVNEPVLLNTQARQVVESAIRNVCEHRRWKLHAVNVRTNHVHTVVSGRASPEKIMADLKAWSTRRLREDDLVGNTQRIWTKHGSTRHLFSQENLVRAVDYVVRMQDAKAERQSEDWLQDPGASSESDGSWPGADA